MRLKPLLRWSLRDLRGWRSTALVFIACLALGVAAVVATQALSGGVRELLRSEAQRLLGADLILSSRRVVPEELLDLARAVPGARLSHTVEVPTLVAAAAPEGSDDTGPSRLALLMAFSGEHPIHGDVVTEPQRPLVGWLTEHDALLAPDLLALLDLEPGDDIVLGGERFEIAGAIVSESDRNDRLLSLGPRVLITRAGLERTPLLGLGSRTFYRHLVGLPEGADGAALAGRLRADMVDTPWVNLETTEGGQRSLAGSLQRGRQFLALIALASLVLGGLGVARATAAWAEPRRREIAAWKALGLRPVEILVQGVLQVLTLALVASLIGAVGGLLLAAPLPGWLEGMLPGLTVSTWRLDAVGFGLVLGIGMALLASLPSLLALHRVPAALVLRADVQPPPLSWPARISLLTVVLGGTWLLQWLQAGEATTAVWQVALVLVAALVLGVAALGLSTLIARWPRRGLPVPLRLAMASLSRSSAGRNGALVALGLGILAVATVTIVQEVLGDQLRQGVPENAPTAFLIDVQPDQREEVLSLLDEHRATEIDEVPVVIGRLQRIGGRSVQQIVDALGAEERGQRWALTREQRLTWRDSLQPDNRIVAGALFEQPEVDEVSVEVEYANDLGIELGDTLVLDVQGRRMSFQVTSLREVDWTSFRINFFLMVEPGVLERAPHSRLIAARLDPGPLQALQDLLPHRLPNVALIQVEDVLRRVADVLGLVAAGVTVMGGFTVAVGLAVLLAVVVAEAGRRRREAALLRALGATRRQRAWATATELGLVGFVASLVGVGFALLLARLVVVELLELGWHWPVLRCVVAIVTATVLSAVVGTWASARGGERPVLEELR
ncbi:MAG: FtsX-like permease family protein [Acidobacteriota bacterium]